MGNRDPKRLLRAAILVIAVVALLGLGACGDGDETNGATDTAQSQSRGETESKAVATGQRLCKLLGGPKALSKSFDTNDLGEVARKFSTEIYIGDFPEAAARGCLIYLKSVAATS